MLPELDAEHARARIAQRVAREIEPGAVVNLGIGLPTLVSDYLPQDATILIHTENGALGAGPHPTQADLRVTGAGGRAISLISGGAFVSSELSFGIIRGGHLDATILGALQVDGEGNLANWCVPGVRVPGMGGAMDLVSNAKKVIVATQFRDGSGRPKLVAKCTLPLTARRVVDMIVTEHCVIRRIGETMIVSELADGVAIGDLLAATDMSLTAGPALQR